MRITIILFLAVLCSSCLNNKPSANYFDAEKIENNTFSVKNINLRKKCRYYIVIDTDDIDKNGVISDLISIVKIRYDNYSRDAEFLGKYFTCNWGDNLHETKFRYAIEINVSVYELSSISLVFVSAKDSKFQIKRVRLVETSVYSNI
jgi:hypothetical protein